MESTFEAHSGATGIDQRIGTAPPVALRGVVSVGNRQLISD